MLRIMLTTLTTLASALLIACGGSGGEDLAARHEFQAQAEAWENRMPSIIVDGGVPCTSLIVFFAIKAGRMGFPDDLRAKAVTLVKPGAPAWQQPVSETGFGTAWISDTDWLSRVGSTDGNPPPGTRSERVLTGVARGCPSPDFREGDTLRATILLATANEQAETSVAVTLQAAY